MRERYFYPEGMAECILEKLTAESLVVEDDGIFTMQSSTTGARRVNQGMRLEAVTQPPAHYAALAGPKSLFVAAPGEEQLRRAVNRSAEGRIRSNSGNPSFCTACKKLHRSHARQALAQGDYFWR